MPCEGDLSLRTRQMTKQQGPIQSENLYKVEAQLGDGPLWGIDSKDGAGDLGDLDVLIVIPFTMV